MDWWEEYEGNSQTVSLAPARPASPAGEKRAEEVRASKKARSPWERFRDQYIAGALHSPLGAEPIVRATLRAKGRSSEDINQAERRLADQFAARDARDEEAFKDVDTLSPENIGKHAVDLLGNILGGVDPTYVLAPGRSALQRAGAQGAINASVDAGGQVIEKARGVRDEIDPDQIALSGAGGVVLQGAGELATRSRRAPLPVSGRITSGFGSRRAPKKGASTNHGGIDIAARIGAPVEAPAGGTVTKVGRGHSKRGNWVEIDHGDGHTSRYLHLSGFNVKPGQTIDEGSIFARTGKTGNVTGPHLHYSVFKNGKAIDPRSARFGARAPDNDPEIGDREGPFVERPFDADSEGMDFQNALRGMEDDLAADFRAVDDDLIRQADDGDARIADIESQIEAGKPWRDIPEEDKAFYIEYQREAIKRDIPHIPLDGNVVAFPKQPAPYAELTPSERAEMDASAPKPINRNTGAEDVLGKGSVATTPVNDIKSETMDDYFDKNGLFHPRRITQAKEYIAKLRKSDDPVLHQEADALEARLPKKGSLLKVIKDMLDDEDGSLNIDAIKEFFRKSSPDAEGGGEVPASVQKLTEALAKTRPLSRQQQRLYSEERSERLGKIAGVQKETGGEAGFYAELGALKGAMKKVNFKSIRDEFNQDDIDELFDLVKNHQTMTLYDKVNARKGLAKLLGGDGGKVPTENELRLLGEVFPKELIAGIKNSKTLKKKIADGLANAINLPRSLMSSFDLSAPFRQGVFLVGRKEFWTAFAGMFRQFGSENAYKALQAEIKSRPNYRLMREAGLALTESTGRLQDREEAFMSEWAENIPVLGRGVRASTRAYEGFLNRLRADVFDDLVRRSKDAGVSFKRDPKALKDIAKFINAATGRGSLGKFNQAAPLLSGGLFSPRLMASRITMLNPGTYIGLSPVVRKEAVKSLLSFGMAATTVLGLASYGLGLDVETDPRSSDWAKIKVGNTRYDVLGGFQQYLKLGAVLATGEKKTTKGDVVELGKGYKADSRLDAIETFFRSKASPVASFVMDALDGENVIGEEFNPTSADPFENSVLQRFLPMFIQDVNEAIKEYGAKGALTAVPAIFGVGAQTYKPRPVKEKEADMSDDWWNEYENTAVSDGWE